MDLITGRLVCKSGGALGTRGAGMRWQRRGDPPLGRASAGLYWRDGAVDKMDRRDREVLEWPSLAPVLSPYCTLPQAGMLFAVSVLAVAILSKPTSLYVCGRLVAPIALASSGRQKMIARRVWGAVPSIEWWMVGRGLFRVRAGAT